MNNEKKKQQIEDNISELSEQIDSLKKELDRLEKLKQNIPVAKTIKTYLYSSKDDMYYVGEENGLTESQLRNFRYALYEVEFVLSVDKEGNTEILKVNGKKLVD